MKLETKGGHLIHMITCNLGDEDETTRSLRIYRSSKMDFILTIKVLKTSSMMMVTPTLQFLSKGGVNLFQEILISQFVLEEQNRALSSLF